MRRGETSAASPISPLSDIQLASKGKGCCQYQQRDQQPRGQERGGRDDEEVEAAGPRKDSESRQRRGVF